MDTPQDTYNALLRKAESLAPGESFIIFRQGVRIGRTKSTKRLRIGSDSSNFGPAHTHWYRGDFETSLRELVDGCCNASKQGYFAADFIRAVRELVA